MHKLTLCLLTLVVILSTGCTKQPAKTPAPNLPPITTPSSEPMPTLIPTPSPPALTQQPSAKPTPAPPTPPPTLPMPKPAPTPTPTPEPMEYPAPSVYYPMKCVNVVGVRPDGKELYVMSHARSTPILIVDIDSPDYPVVGKIDLPGRVGGHTCICFSSDSKHAYVSRVIDRTYEDNPSAGFSDLNKIVIINTETRTVEYAIPMPQPYAPREFLAPSPDGKWLYFAAADFAGKRMGIGKIDLKTRTMAGFLQLDGVNFLNVSPDGKYICATQGTKVGAPPRIETQAPNLFTVIDAATFQVIGSVQVGNGPWYAAVSPDGSKAYVSNQWSNDISVVDLKTMKVVTTIGMENVPYAIVFRPDGARAYITIPGTYFMYNFGNTVAVIDTSRDVLISTLKVHIEPLSMAIDPDGTRVYVSDGNANGNNPAEVHIIDAVNDAYLRPIILRAPARVMPSAIDITPDGKKLFVVSEAAKEQKSVTSLLAVDAATGATTGKLGIQPRGVKVSKDGSKVYVFCEQQLAVVDAKTFSIVKSIDLKEVYPRYPAFFNQDAFRIVLSSNEDIAYLVGKSSEVVVIDMAQGRIKARIPFAKATINHSRGLAITPDDRKLFVSDYNSETVAVIDAASNAILANIPVGILPSEVKISKDGKRAYVLQQQNPTMITVIDVDSCVVVNKLNFPIGASMDFELSTDGRIAYVAEFDPNFLLVYDMNTGKALKVLDVGLDPFNMALSTDGKLIYLTNMTTDDISVVDTTTNSVVKTIKLGS